MKFEHRNAYICENCRYVTLTVHIHEGTTPMMLGCRNPVKCEGMAISFYYQLPGVLAMNGPGGKIAPTHEWYTPESLEGLSPGEAEHVSSGGVLLRERTDAVPMEQPKTAKP